MPKGAQERFYGYHENIDFPKVFLGFWRSGLPLELQMDALGAYGRHFWPNVGYLVSLFGELVRMIDF